MIKLTNLSVVSKGNQYAWIVLKDSKNDHAIASQDYQSNNCFQIDCSTLNSGSYKVRGILRDGLGRKVSQDTLFFYVSPTGDLSIDKKKSQARMDK